MSRVLSFIKKSFKTLHAKYYISYLDTYTCSKSAQTCKGTLNTKFRIVVISGKEVKVSLRVLIAQFLLKIY